MRYSLPVRPAVNYLFSIDAGNVKEKELEKQCIERTAWVRCAEQELEALGRQTRGHRRYDVSSTSPVVSLWMQSSVEHMPSKVEEDVGNEIKPLNSVRRSDGEIGKNSFVPATAWPV